MTDQTRRLVERQILVYGEACTGWKPEHDEAINRADLEFLLAAGLSLFDHINRLDESWRQAVLERTIAFDPTFSGEILRLYRLWLRPCVRVISDIDELERGGQVVLRSAEFRGACREVEGILTPDADFFVGDRLVQARDAAIDSHQANLTEEME